MTLDLFKDSTVIKIFFLLFKYTFLMTFFKKLLYGPLKVNF